MDISYVAAHRVVVARCKEQLLTEQNNFTRLQQYVAQHGCSRLLLDFRRYGDLPYNSWEALFRNLIPKLTPQGPSSSPCYVALLGLPSQQSGIEVHLPAPYFQDRQGYQAKYFALEAEALVWLSAT